MTDPAHIHALDLKDITFDHGHLWMPSYPSLINYNRSPEDFRIEPAVQLLDPDLTYEISLKLGEGDSFFLSEGAGTTVKCRAIDKPGDAAIPGLVERVRIAPKECRLVIDPRQAKAKMIVLRIFCGKQQMPADHTPEWKYTMIEGGVYVALLFHPKTPRPLPPAVTEKHHRLPATIRVLGIDRHCRPVYDLFLPQASQKTPRQVELEPCFRARLGHKVNLSMAIHIKGLEFVADSQDETRVAVSPFHPGRVHPHLRYRHFGARGGQKCMIQWSRAESLDPKLGEMASFAFRVKIANGLSVQEWLDRQDLAEGERAAWENALDDDGVLRDFDVDPTVIGPPNCFIDSMGNEVCLPPPQAY
jgi:hypothetical protein